MTEYRNIMRRFRWLRVQQGRLITISNQDNAYVRYDESSLSVMSQYRSISFLLSPSWSPPYQWVASDVISLMTLRLLRQTTTKKTPICPVRLGNLYGLSSCQLLRIACPSYYRVMAFTDVWWTRNRAVFDWKRRTKNDDLVCSWSRRDTS